MILAIDIGNSNIIIGCISDKIRFIERISTELSRTEVEYAVQIRSIMSIHNVADGEIDGAIISSVVPQLTRTLKTAVSKLYKVRVMIVGPGLKTGLNVRIDNPAQLGSDLLVDSVAAIAEYEAPLIVIDMGTATSFCVINRQKQYIGGVIMPGVRTSLDSLVSKTSLLQQISLEAPIHVIGRNTIDCMKSGAVYGNAAYIDGMIARIEAELGETCTVIATGSPAHAIIPFCERKIRIDDSLMLKGLKVIYEKNHKG